MRVDYGKLLLSPESTFVAFACMLFAGAYRQSPLFSSNQNTYFLIGLANAKFGYLCSDWLAHQTDSAPVFSALVSLIHRLGVHWVFYLIHGLLAALYAWSLLVIIRHASPSRLSLPALAVASAVLTMLHASWTWSWLAPVVPGLWRMVALAHDATHGMAGQYLLGPCLQPSAFGVLLLASVALFLKKREYLAVACAAVAETVHPTYVLPSGILTGAYLLSLWVEKDRRKTVLVAVLALMLVLPILLYVTLFFAPTDSTTSSRAREILVDHRIPHHAKISAWFSGHVLFQMGLISVGLLLARRDNRLFVLLAFCFFASAALTTSQMVSGNRALALLFPWRTSTWLVPTATAIAVGWVSVAATGCIQTLPWARIRSGARGSLLALSIVFLVAACLWRVQKDVSFGHANRRPVVSFVTDHARQDQTYLVPLELEWFRLETGVPIFVDWKSHPYRDNEVVEWYERVAAARAFYDAGDPSEAQEAVSRIRRLCPVTHIVTKPESAHLLDATGAQLVYEGDGYVVLRLDGDI